MKKFIFSLMFLATAFAAAGQNIVPKDSLAKFNKETLTIKGYRLSGIDVKDGSGKKNTYSFLIRDLSTSTLRALVLRVNCSQTSMGFISGEFDYADLKRIVNEVEEIQSRPYPSDDIAYLETIITANSGSYVKSHTYTSSDSQKKTTWEIGLTDKGAGIAEPGTMDELIAKFKEAIAKMESLM